MRKIQIRKKNLKHAIEKRKTMLKKLSDPNDKDDPRWVQAFLGHAEVRIARKEKAKSHRQSQRKVGRRRTRKGSLDY